MQIFDHFSPKIVKNWRKMIKNDEKWPFFRPQKTRFFVSSYTGTIFWPLARPLSIFRFFFSRNFQKLLARPLSFWPKKSIFGPIFDQKWPKMVKKTTKKSSKIDKFPENLKNFLCKSSGDHFLCKFRDRKMKKFSL